MLQMQKAPSDPIDCSHKCCNLATRESLLVCVREKRGFLLRKINNKPALILVYSCLCLTSYFKTFVCTFYSCEDTFIFGVFSSCFICLTLFGFCMFHRTTWEAGFVGDHGDCSAVCVCVCFICVCMCAQTCVRA